MSFGYVKIWTKIRDTLFFIDAESYVKKVKISLKKNWFFSFEVNIVETMGDRKKCFK